MKRLGEKIEVKRIKDCEVGKYAPVTGTIIGIDEEETMFPYLVNFEDIDTVSKILGCSLERNSFYAKSVLSLFCTQAIDNPEDVDFACWVKEEDII